MASQPQDTIWLAFSDDGSLRQWGSDQFPGATRYVIDRPDALLPDVRQARALALHSDRKIKYAVREIQREFARKARAITDELIQLYPEASGALHLASARIEELFDFNGGRSRRRVVGLRARLQCLLGFHRLIPMSWLTLNQEDGGLVCNRCFKHVAG